jgi:hypothetical protein
MRIKPILAPMVIVALSLAVPGSGASALPGNYARAHPGECAKADIKDGDWRMMCMTAAWCAQHIDDYWKLRFACDPFVAKADRRLSSVALSQGGLAAARDLSDAETRSECRPDVEYDWDQRCSLIAFKTPQGGADDSLLPPGMKTAKLAMRADIAMGPFPVTVVRIGIGGGGAAQMTVSWAQNGNGPRVSNSVRLNAAEIDRLLAALNKSDFWRLPQKTSHQGAADGEAAAVEIAIAGRHRHVQDFIGDSDAVELSVLVNALSEIIRSHWKDVPGG